ncbi:MAG: hypothetical protein A2806_00895 [Candidatus Terrybacteria bacterium RIFCSPHIGHO2_01_FULL_48_17]|uniref:HotDog ACOT-type domain-containing protein n=1 Tax=Candidatus Terrybacteria bacterium RIFCSPHIGHO2_01_FULL_48_17 TaxID=1802362 RepID=A0A1G2PK92_9BACT|nr:MAG: hypothetical protein A2806_00895 [Candidatus Terrybacteria bacterium RIFCSPHIGHO2_01_FULL_48_17]OHA52921.1 MAG: hypothetical protein A3A30_01455 [Candidatus Terrybacteria bacterium RIFCSPLOWO2_01_FULL_48_14]
MERLAGKPVSDSAFEHRERVFPHHLNPGNILYGGWIPFWADSVAALCAERHCGIPIVTAVMDGIHLLCPVTKNDVLLFKASVNRVWDSSCEVGVKIYAENPYTRHLRHVATGYFVMVSMALGPDGKRISMPKVIPETEDEKRRFKQAAVRNRRRKAERKKMLKENQTA